MTVSNNNINVPVPRSPRFEWDVSMAIGRIKESLGTRSTPAFAGVSVGAGSISATAIGQWNAAYSASHAAVTIPASPNGLSLTGQEISLPVTATPTLHGLTSTGDIELTAGKKLFFDGA